MGVTYWSPYSKHEDELQRYFKLTGVTLGKCFFIMLIIKNNIVWKPKISLKNSKTLVTISNIDFMHLNVNWTSVFDKGDNENHGQQKTL